VQGEGVPDGSCIDEDDCLWNAEWGAGRVTRYRPDGSIDLQIELPVSQPTCVGFGGPDNSFLCVTTARDELSAEQSSQQPQAGHLFIYKTGFRGSPVNHVKTAAE
jgi:sugar lactone lactonase YvrE